MSDLNNELDLQQDKDEGSGVSIIRTGSSSWWQNVWTNNSNVTSFQIHELVKKCPSEIV